MEPPVDGGTSTRGAEAGTGSAEPSVAGGAEASGRRQAGAVLTAPPPELHQERARPTPRLARTQGRPQGEPRRRRRSERYIKTMAALVAVAAVLFLVGGGGYLASRQYFFVGTNSSGLVTVFRGFPYSLPLGINMYEQYYVSGVPAAAIPRDRRGQLLNHRLRSQSDAISLVRAAELGQLSR
jgi:protein phosphatase